MALKAKSKDIILNMVYSLGAAIVILGAWMKITHTNGAAIGMPGLDGTLMLTIGLVTEAIIFIVFAFDPPTGDYAWEKAYPELLEAGAVKATKKKAVVNTDAELNLSDKLDKMLADAKLDTALFERLRGGIENFGDAVSQINKTTDAAAATQNYGDQLALAANHMESLNALYQLQVDHGNKQVELTKSFIDNMEVSANSTSTFVKEMNNLTGNITNLNKVYGGMLSAMKAS